MRASSAARQFAAWTPLAALLIVLPPALAAAQEPVKSFDQLGTLAPRCPSALGRRPLV